MKSNILFLVCVSCVLTSKSQSNRELDSLLNLLNKKNTDTIQLQTYRAIGDYYMYNNASKAIEYFEHAKSIAIKLNRTLDIASNYYSIGFCNLLKGKYDLSLDNYFQSVRLYEKLNDDRRLANAYLSIINVYTSNSNIAKANEYYDKANSLILARKDSDQLINLLSSKSQLYYNQSKYDSALFYLSEQYKVSNLIRDTLKTISLLSNMGLMYKKLNRNREALEYCSNALSLLNKVNANDYYPIVYNNLGSIYSAIGNYKDAKESFDKSIAYSLQIGNKSVEMENYLNLSDMYGRMENYKSQNEFLKKYYTIKDSLFTLDSRNQMTQLEADYQLGKKNIEIVKKDADIKAQKNQRNIFIVIALATFILLSTLYYFFVRIQKKKALLEEKNTQIQKQKTELENLNIVKDRLFSILSHDIRNPLLNIRSYLLLTENENLNTEQKAIYKNQTLYAVSQTGEMLDNFLIWANMQIKNTQTTITPINLKDCVSDIISVLQIQVDQKKISLVSTIDEILIPSDYHILSIALRNLLTNAIKFSHENQIVHIQSKIENNYLYLTIQDHGIGMNEDQIQQIYKKENISTLGTQGEKGSGLGLFLVNELLSKINTELIIKSKLNEGSQFILKIPLL
jgi:signal transduction histidine kinase